MLDVNLESSLTYFKHTNIDEVNVLLSKMCKTTCMLDPLIDVIVRIINLTFLLHHFLLHLNQLLSSHSLKNLQLTAIF